MSVAIDSFRFRFLNERAESEWFTAFTNENISLERREVYKFVKTRNRNLVDIALNIFNFPAKLDVKVVRIFFNIFIVHTFASNVRKDSQRFLA